MHVVGVIVKVAAMDFDPAVISCGSVKYGSLAIFTVCLVKMNFFLILFDVKSRMLRRE